MSQGLNPWILPGLVGAAVIGAAAVLLRSEPVPPPPPPAKPSPSSSPQVKATPKTEVVGPQPKNPIAKLPQLQGMIRALKEERDPRNRAQAAAYLGSHSKHCGLEELQLLRTTLVEDAAPEVRAAAARALGRFGLRALPARKVLRTASKRDRVPTVREAAQAALVAIEAARKPN